MTPNRPALDGSDEPDRRPGWDGRPGCDGPGGRPGPEDTAYLRHRGLVFYLAYDITGSVADAEDVTQGVYLRWRAAGDAVRDPRAWLARVATNLAIDRLRARREVPYPGEWLPEPIVESDESETRALRAEEVSMALLVVLETLSPLERASFLLVDVFRFSSVEAAEMLERTPEAVRQLLSRARRRLAQSGPRRQVSSAEHREVVERFLAAARAGDLSALTSLVGTDVVLHSDGGGVVSAARKPIVGRDNVVRFLVGLAGQHVGRFDLEPRLVNGSLGWLLWLDGNLDQVVGCHVEDGVITRIFLQRNPTKLRTDV